MCVFVFKIIIEERKFCHKGIFKIQRILASFIGWAQFYEYPGSFRISIFQISSFKLLKQNVFSKF